MWDCSILEPRHKDWEASYGSGSCSQDYPTTSRCGPGQGRVEMVPFTCNYLEMCQDIALLLYSRVYFKDLPGCADTHRGMIPENQSSLAPAVCALVPESLSPHLCVLAKVSLCSPYGWPPPLIFFLLWCDHTGNCEKIFTEEDMKIFYADHNFHSFFSWEKLAFSSLLLWG